jgi:sulfur carrier protein ThiS
MEEHMDTGIAVSINGEIYRDHWAEKIPQDAEVFLLPRLQGG